MGAAAVIIHASASVYYTKEKGRRGSIEEVLWCLARCCLFAIPGYCWCVLNGSKKKILFRRHGGAAAAATFKLETASISKFGKIFVVNENR